MRGHFIFYTLLISAPFFLHIFYSCCATTTAIIIVVVVIFIIVVVVVLLGAPAGCFKVEGLEVKNPQFPQSGSARRGRGLGSGPAGV